MCFWTNPTICNNTLIKPSYGKLCQDKVDLKKLNTNHLTMYLRICWRLRNRKEARLAVLELMTRSERNHSTLIVIAHIFPKMGMRKEASSFAKDIFSVDPKNQLAISLL